MRVVIQRAARASVTINVKETRSMGKGLVVLLGIEEADADDDIDWLVNKIINLRLFDDDGGVMNLSLQDIDGEVMVVSQFTLHARTKKGNRPSYIDAAKPEFSIPMYEKFIRRLSEKMGKAVVTGEFGAMMAVDLVNDGPITIVMDTKNKQ